MDPSAHSAKGIPPGGSFKNGIGGFGWESKSFSRACFDSSSGGEERNAPVGKEAPETLVGSNQNRPRKGALNNLPSKLKRGQKCPSRICGKA
ncbi:hypothetical protein RRG08_015248 [Elysia crispata]|uniref:Uncharacterized protein n=1 Tax=Elysia crispata TaxID=231223 RepID=A0AAE0YZS6_9GAST|nr:hypothetical protein RRG08_015248 [Elysia crispata]